MLHSNSVALALALTLALALALPPMSAVAQLFEGDFLLHSLPRALLSARMSWLSMASLCTVGARGQHGSTISRATISR